jgi:hypothetical protein
MSLEQTSQLIQLVLNSALMVTACVIVLGGLQVRHMATHRQLRSLSQEYAELMGDAVLRGDRLLQVKHQLRQLRQHYQDAYRSILVIHYALLSFVLSGLTVALRTIANADWLIGLALVLFIAGLAILLLGLGLTLADLHTAKRSLWDEINWVLSLGDLPALKEAAPTRSARPQKAPRKVARSVGQSSPKTGVV